MKKLISCFLLSHIVTLPYSFSSELSSDSLEYSITDEEGVAKLHDNSTDHVVLDLAKKVSEEAINSALSNLVNTKEYQDQETITDEVLNIVENDEGYYNSSYARIIARDVNVETTVKNKNIIQQLIEKYQLEPLVDSDYWLENKNLPYSKCVITTSDGEWGFEISKSLILGKTKRRTDNHLLFCYSRDLHLSYLVPISLSNDKNAGFSMNASETYPKIKLSKLDEKELRHVFGKYNGFDFSLGYIAQAKKSVLRKNGIKLNFKTSINIGGGLTASYRHLNLSLRILSPDETYSFEYKKCYNELEEIKYFEDTYFGQKNKLYASMKKDLEARRNALSKEFTEKRKYNDLHRYWVHHLVSSNEESADLYKKLNHEGVLGLKFKYEK